MMKQNNIIDNEVVQKILEDQPARREITKQSHLLFFHLYFFEHATYQTADFHRELFDITEDDKIKLAVIVAFRGSGKSTIMTTSYPLWAVLGKQQKKCVVILSKTQQQAKTHFANIKRTLESNELLKKDLGPFQEESDEWGAYSIVIPRYDARLVAASSEQSIRGIRHGAYRPDLVICDDVEDISSVKTKESRDGNFAWFNGEVLPIGDKNTKFIVVGNLLHSDSMLMRIKKNLEQYPTGAKYLEIPVIDENNQITWPGKYQSMDEVINEQKRMGDEKTWQREYMLKIIADEDQIVLPNWIKTYDELPQDTDKFRNVITAVDLAISEKASADYTAIVTAIVFGYMDEKRVYILPNPINKRLSFPETEDEVKKIYAQKFYNERTTVYIEDVGYQKAIIQQLVKGDVDVKGFQVHGRDKRSRLSSITPMIRHGQVLFPKEGAEDLIQQLLYFGTEKHDDLVDAFTMVMHVVMDQDHEEPVPITAEIAALLRGGGGSYIPGRDGPRGGGTYWF